MRFASREKAVLSQWEVGAGLVPGGGPMARLPRLMGRGRALEVLLARCRRYPRRSRRALRLCQSVVSGFRTRRLRRSARETYCLVRQAGDRGNETSCERREPPPDLEIKPEWDAFIASLERPASQKRIKALMERGFHRAGDVENRLGFHVGQIGD